MPGRDLTPPNSRYVLAAVEQALCEDLDSPEISTNADITTRWTTNGQGDRRTNARIIARKPGIIAGIPLVKAVFARLDPSVSLHVKAGDGASVTPDEVVAEISGPAAAILVGERTALNFLQRLSGVATLTHCYCEAVTGTGAHITDTRKTTPGLRALEKYAVRCGGGTSHRRGLNDAVLIKENHIIVAGSALEAVRRARRHASAEGRPETRVMCEVESIEQLQEIIDSADSRPDRILLDNMSPTTLRQCVVRVREAAAQIETEATGGLDLSTVRAVAETGVDVISIGALTHSAPALDFSLLFSESR
ncbi:MAG: carboxylating nicotinate-nucleotide diphosphorylase [Candidatus Latescibacterota bacterium]|nr:carboxylating nicotinate-nucleotide diphosphorylase [Candidatus Latescibacterota bacterium]